MSSNSDLIASIVEKRNKVGYKSSRRDIDVNDLTGYFNICIERIYDNILHYFDEGVLNLIYPILYNYLSIILDTAIKDKLSYIEFYSIFHKEAARVLKESIKTYNINIFSEGYLLSYGNFTDIETSMMENTIHNIIANNQNKDAALENERYICSKFGFSKVRYYLETIKLGIALSKMYKNKERQSGSISR